MSKTGDAFLWTAKELYLKEIHPYDFSMTSTEEYQRLIGLGKQLLFERGLQDFLGLLMEGQYRVHVWVAYIGLEYGNPGRNEILKISGKQTIVEHCIGLIHDIAQRLSEGPIKQNEENWVARMKAKYSVE